MKKFILKTGMMIAIGLSISAVSNAQISVRIRPSAPLVKVRPARPTPHHVWIGGEWRWNNNNYDYVDGYWSEPERGRHRWVEGHWKHMRDGWVWVPGHWR